MKATIERATLLRCLSHVQSVVERRNTIPILSNVLIDADAGGGVSPGRQSLWMARPARLRPTRQKCPQPTPPTKLPKILN